MKHLLCAFVLGIFCFDLASAQPAAPQGPHFGGAMNKLFGEHTAFSATLEMQGKDEKGEMATIPGKLDVDAGRSRFELDMTQVKPNRVTPAQAAQMKQFGLDKIVMVDRPDKKVGYMIYAGLQSYVESPLKDRNATAAPDDFKVEITELGKETVDGHPCVKSKAVVTDKDGKKSESTIWNATDLKNFPVRIRSTEGGGEDTLSFRDITFAKPAASLFEPPTGYTKYDSMMAMMRDQMMKQMGGALPFGR